MLCGLLTTICQAATMTAQASHCDGFCFAVLMAASPLVTFGISVQKNLAAHNLRHAIDGRGHQGYHAQKARMAKDLYEQQAAIEKPGQGAVRSCTSLAPSHINDTSRCFCRS